MSKMIYSKQYEKYFKDILENIFNFSHIDDYKWFGVF
jgi:hypothetical protein